MKFGKLSVVVFVALVAFGGSVAAHAQLGVYGMYQGNQLSGIQCFAATGTTCSSPNGKVNPSGGMGGVFYDFRNFGPVRLGVDARAGVVRANKSAVTSAGGAGITTADSFLGGVRGSVKTPFAWLKPYVQGSVGFARSDASEPVFANAPQPSPKVYDKFIQYEFFAGTDVKIFSLLDLRPIEVGIGEMSRIGNGSGSSSITIKSIGAGVVFHLPAR